jgi:hypothetical protein
MAESIFFRPPDQGLVKELHNRYLGKTNIRAQSLFVQEGLWADPPTISEAVQNPRVFAYATVYNEDEQLVLARGDSALVDGLPDLPNYFPGVKTAVINGESQAAYAFTGLEVEFGGKFGSLRNCSIVCEILAPQPEKGSTEWNELFSFIEQSFFVGKRILIQYGYFDPFTDSQVVGYNEKYHKTPNDINDTLPGKSKQKGYVFTVTDPSYTITAQGTVRFNVKGIGPGAEALERGVLPNANKSFADIFAGGTNVSSNTGFGKYKSIVEQDQTMPYFISDYDLDDGEGRYLQVQNIVDWIDFDIQARLRHFEGKDKDDDFEALNGRGLLGTNHWNPPPVDREGDYSNVGFVCMEFQDEGYYDNAFAINTGTGDDYAYYVTLQYLCWLINWTSQSKILPVNASARARQQIQRKGSIFKTDGVPSNDVYKYIIKCDGETTRGKMIRKTKNKRGEEEKFPLPSADPCSVLFTYGDCKSDPLATANYGTLHNKYNWLYGAAGGVIAIGGTALGLGSSVVPAVAIGGTIAAMGFYKEVEPIILFATEEWDTLQAASIAPGEGSHRTFQNRLSMQGSGKNKMGDLSRMLINRDCIASILDELGGLKRSDVSSKEENLAKSSDLQSNTNTNVSKVSMEAFFNKLFSVIKAASGGSIDLFLLPDPDEKDMFTSRLLVKNRKEQGVDAKVDIPMFNRNDGNVLDLNLKSKIPKAMQVAAAVGDDQSLAPDAEDEKEEDQVKVPEGDIMYIDIVNGKDALTKSKFATDSVSALSTMLSKIGINQSKADKVEFGTEIFPLEMSLRIQGIEGFKFGDVIQCKMIPARYLTKQGKNRIIFSVLSVRHLHSDYGWQTELKTIMRFMPDKYANVQQIDTDNLNQFTI